jgi:hypothetical protein
VAAITIQTTAAAKSMLGQRADGPCRW